jgi:hypothetical protein
VTVPRPPPPAILTQLLLVQVVRWHGALGRARRRARKLPGVLLTRSTRAETYRILTLSRLRGVEVAAMQCNAM